MHKTCRYGCVNLNESPSLSKLYTDIKSALENQNFKVSEPKEIAYGIQFRIAIDKKTELFRIYQNKKGEIKFDFSQVKDRDNLKVIREIIQNTSDFPQKTGKKQYFKEEEHIRSKKSAAAQDSSVLNNLKFPIIGTDESGKGDYFGPLVTAGIYVDEESASFLREIGVTDSKLMDDRQIKIIAKKIRENCPECYSIIEISPERYNRLYEQLKCENKNLNSLLAWAHAKAIEDVLAKKDCDTAISDQFADERYILGRLQTRGRKIRLLQMHRAERNIAVAAASVLARDKFLEKMESLSKDAGIILPKGASPAVVSAGKEIVKKNGRDALLKYAKVHFKTTGDILKN